MARSSESYSALNRNVNKNSESAGVICNKTYLGH